MPNFFPLPGASAAAMLIFILPSAFYIKLVKKESMKSVQKIGVRGWFLIPTHICKEFAKHYQNAISLKSIALVEHIS